jgi:hypothetical protein
MVLAASRSDARPIAQIDVEKDAKHPVESFCFGLTGQPIPDLFDRPQIAIHCQLDEISSDGALVAVRAKTL